ncbi:MAG: hypothetical protein ACXW1Z_24450 [Methylobacter sp.]
MTDENIKSQEETTDPFVEVRVKINYLGKVEIDVWINDENTYTYELRDAAINVRRAYWCQAKQQQQQQEQQQAPMLRNKYEILLIPNYNYYPLPTLEVDADSWILTPIEPVERFEFLFSWQGADAVKIFFTGILKNLRTGVQTKIASDDLLLEKYSMFPPEGDGFDYAKASPLGFMSNDLYSCLISPDFRLFLKLPPPRQAKILEEVLALLRPKKKKTRSHQSQDTNSSDFDLPSKFVERLVRLSNLAQQEHAGDKILLLKPSLWGMGIDLRELKKLISRKFKKS